MSRAGGAGDIVRAVDDVDAEQRAQFVHRDRARDDRRRARRRVHHEGTHRTLVYKAEA